MLFIGRAQDLAFVGPGGAEQAFKIKAGDHIFHRTVSIVAPLFGVKCFIARRQYDGADFYFHLLQFLMQIDGVVFTDPFTNGTFFLFQIEAVFMNIGDQGNGLGKIDMDSFIGR